MIAEVTLTNELSYDVQSGAPHDIAADSDRYAARRQMRSPRVAALGAKREIGLETATGLVVFDTNWSGAMPSTNGCGRGRCLDCRLSVRLGSLLEDQRGHRRGSGARSDAANSRGWVQQEDELVVVDLRDARTGGRLLAKQALLPA